jgi:flagellar basal-body rod modification protein FlgD
MAIAPIGGSPPAANAAPTATDAFGLQFQDLLRIVLTQLTFQDPLKPMDSFEFVSQLAQFSQIQQSQTINDRLQILVQAGASSQAASLLGRIVEAGSEQALIRGRVVSVSFRQGEPSLTIRTADGQRIANVSPSTVTSIAVEE